VMIASAVGTALVMVDVGVGDGEGIGLKYLYPKYPVANKTIKTSTIKNPFCFIMDTLQTHS